MRLDLEAAREAIRTKIADPLGMTVDEAAVGIVEIADSHMADLMRQVTVERGYDVRDFTAFLYGGGGPLHGTAYAARLGLKSLVVPGAALASVFSAFGIAAADVHYTLERTEEHVAPFDAPAIQRALGELETAATARLAGAGVPPERRFLQRFVEMRYGFQTHQIAVPVPSGELTSAAMEQLSDEFEAAYERLYGKGSAYREAGIEIASFRLQAFGSLQRPAVQAGAGGSGGGGPKSVRSVLWPELRERTETPVYLGADLAGGSSVDGPAIVELPTTTVAVRPGQRLEVDKTNNYVIYEG
jgi:N-methylhydantoinase A